MRAARSPVHPAECDGVGSSAFSREAKGRSAIQAPQTQRQTPRHLLRPAIDVARAGASGIFARRRSPAATMPMTKAADEGRYVTRRRSNRLRGWTLLALGLVGIEAIAIVADRQWAFRARLLAE